MDQDIQRISQQLFPIAQKAQLLSGNYEDTFGSSVIDQIKIELNSKKEHFLKNNQDLAGAEQLWLNDLDQRIRDEVVFIIKEKSLENKKAVTFDWRFSAEDVVFNIKEILPDFDIVSLGEKQVSGDWVENIVIEGEQYQFKLESDERMYEIFDAINDHLKKRGLKFVQYHTGGDDCCFILISREADPDIKELGLFIF